MMNFRSDPCFGCKYFWTDESVNACECKKAESGDMTEYEFEHHFCNGEIGCPHFEEVEDVDYEF